MGAPTELDRYGLGFRTASEFVNIYFGLGGYGDLSGETADVATLNSLGTFTITAVPEPATFALLGTGLLFFVGAVSRNRAKAVT